MVVVVAVVAVVVVVATDAVAVVVVVAAAAAAAAAVVAAIVAVVIVVAAVVAAGVVAGVVAGVANVGDVALGGFLVVVVLVAAAAAAAAGVVVVGGEGGGGASTDQAAAQLEAFISKELWAQLSSLEVLTRPPGLRKKLCPSEPCASFFAERLVCPVPIPGPCPLFKILLYGGGGKVSTYCAVEGATSVAKTVDGVTTSTLAELSDSAQEFVQESMQESYSAEISRVVPCTASDPTTSPPHRKLSAGRTAWPVDARAENKASRTAEQEDSCHVMERWPFGAATMGFSSSARC